MVPSARRRSPGGGAQVASLAVVLLIAVAAVVALGRPDVSLARDFLTSARPVRAGALAAIQLLVWALVGASLIVQVLDFLRSSTTVAADVRRRRVRAQVALLAGLLVFVGGAIHHQAEVGSLCCGDTARASRLLR